MPTIALDTFSTPGDIVGRVSDTGDLWTKTSGSAEAAGGYLVPITIGTYPTQIALIEAHTARSHTTTGTTYIAGVFNMSMSDGYGYVSFGLMSSTPSEVSIESFAGDPPKLGVYTSPGITYVDISAELINGANEILLAYRSSGSLTVALNGVEVYSGAYGKTPAMPVGMYYAAHTEVTAGVNTFLSTLSRLEMYEGAPGPDPGPDPETTIGWWCNLLNSTQEPS